MPERSFFRAIFRRQTKRSHEKQQLNEDELANTENDGASTSSRDCPLPSWRVENFLVRELLAEDWKCRLEDDENACNSETFFNRGEELWHNTREAWRDCTASNVAPSRPLSQKGTLALVNFMKEKEGAHPLPRRIPLSCMVQIYNQHVWNDNETSCDASEIADLQHV